MTFPFVYYLYNAIIEIAYVIGYPIIRYALYRHSYQEAIRIPKKRYDKPILIHAASVGEINAIIPIIRYLQDSGVAFVINTITVAGRNHAKKLFPDVDVRLSVLDTKKLKRNALNALSPRLILIVETEIWPNLLAQSALQEIPVIFINARISEKTLRSFMPFRSLLRAISRSVKLIIVQSYDDKARFEKLFDIPIVMGGNLKFNVDLPQYDSSQIRAEWGFSQEDHIIVWGSSRPKEEELILGVFTALKPSVPSLKLIIAPRHPNRLQEVLTLLDAFDYALLSQIDDSSKSFDILIIDGLGKLNLAYACADITIVGGSFYDFGGHNPLEPAFYGKSIIIGNYHSSCKDSVKQLLKHDAIKVSSEKELLRDLQYLIENPKESLEMGKRARIALTKNASALDNHIKEIKKWID